MNIPKLTPVGQDLTRVETPNTVQDFRVQPSPSTNLERTIVANEIIINAIHNYTIDYWKFDNEIRAILSNRVEEIKETLGEQKLSLQLLRLLEHVNGDKSRAAEWLKKQVDNF